MILFNAMPTYNLLI